MSGADPVESSPSFGAMLDRIEGNGVRLVIEDAGRFARDLLVQEAGLAMLASRGVRVRTSTGDDLTAMRKMMCQIIGAVMAEKARLVTKLRAADPDALPCAV